MSGKTRLAVLVVLLLSFALGAPAFAQSGAGIHIHAVDDSDFPMLTVVASVVDANGRPITGLTVDDFVVLEDGTRATLLDAQPVVNTDLGIAVVLAIDVSSSMVGYPLNSTKEAATAFVISLNPADEVAVVAFADSVTVVQNFTTDKDLASEAINNLTTGGRTALYDGAFHAVQVAGNSSLSRRMVVLLSDANEYGRISVASRGDAFIAARDAGIPIYSIALGSAVDEPYMRELATLTGGEVFVAPTPVQIVERYGELANLLRNQYVLTIDSQVLADGGQHVLNVRLANSGAQANRSFTSRSIAPEVVLNGLEAGETLEEPTTITLERADIGSAFSAVSYAVDGQPVFGSPQPPYALTLDPNDFISGTHTLSVEVQDVAGNLGEAQLVFVVPALPPIVSLPVLDGVESLTTAVVLDPQVSGQSPVRQVTYTIDGSSVHTTDEEPYRYTLNPSDLASGDHTLSILVEDEAGQQASAAYSFEVGSAPVNLTLVGLGAGAVVFFVLLVLALAGVVLALRRRPAATVTTAEPQQDEDFDAWLEVDVGGDQRGEYFPITKERSVIGRSPRCDFVLRDVERYVSREHSVVYHKDARYMIEDLGSTRGTTVNGRDLHGAHILTNGDEIRMGSYILRFQQLVYDEDMEVTRVQPTEQSVREQTELPIKTDPLEEKQRRARRRSSER